MEVDDIREEAVAEAAKDMEEAKIREAAEAAVVVVVIPEAEHAVHLAVHVANTMIGVGEMHNAREDNSVSHINKKSPDENRGFFCSMINQICHVL